MAHIVTGFGPTNAPTGGTLSLMFQTMFLQRRTGLSCTIVISNLGAWCSRRLDAVKIALHTEWFRRFLQALGAAQTGATVRTHEDLNILRIAGILTRFLHRRDFETNREATTSLYGRLGLLGNEFGMWTDSAYTVADILEPLMFRRKSRVLVVAGLEEHYFVDLARIAMRRMQRYQATRLIGGDAKIGGLYAPVIAGLSPYPKMSKSIPNSAVSLADSPAEIHRKIMEGPPDNDPVVMQLMRLASDWNQETLRAAHEAFVRRHDRPTVWHKWKLCYTTYFLRLKQLWDDVRPRGGTCNDSIFSLDQSSMCNRT